MHDHVAGAERIDRLDLRAVGIRVDVAGLHPLHGPGAADEPAVPDVGQERAQAVVHRLVTVAEGIEDVANRRDVEVVPEQIEGPGIVSHVMGTLHSDGERAW